MGGEYFSDILDSGDKAMDYEVDKPYKVEDLKTLSFKAKSTPTKNTNLA